MDLYAKNGSFALANCAVEFQVALPATGQSKIFQRYFATLINIVEQAVIDEKPKEAKEIHHVLKILRKQKPDAPNAEELEAINFSKLFRSDDGWPECSIAHAAKCLKIALTFQDEKCRWLAQAALYVAGLYEKNYQKQKDAARNGLRNAINPPTKGEDYGQQ